MEPLQLEELMRREAPRIVAAIREAAHGANEAEFRRPVANLIEDFARAHLDVSFRVQEERTLIAGRADAVYNRFVIEYEPPGSLHSSNGYKANQHAIGQVKQYIEELHRLERHRVERMAGVATDGSWYIFARHREGAWAVDDPIPVTAESTVTFLRYLASLSTEVALTADHLVRDFGENTTVSRLCVSTFYDLLSRTDSPKVKVLFDQWSQQFAEVCGYDEGARQLDIRRLGRNYGVQDLNPNAFRLFFSIHTYYALFIKVLALQVTHFYLAPKLGTGLQQVASYPSEQLLAYLKKVERGGIFKDLGINNFLEGDFFGWYLDLWDDAVDKAARRLISELANYSLVTLDVDPEQTRDLLKKLYQNVMPKWVRHNLGQYYTPDWLAERLLNQLGYMGDPNKRLLDPACGSGTFLVLAIQRVKRFAAERMMPEADVLEKILANIVGFDLDPLAVMSARTNYLLQVGDLIQHRRGEISIPVYLADSILTPAQMEEMVAPDVKRLEPGQKQARMMGAEERQFRFKTVVGQFAVPGSLVTAQYVDQLAGLLEECVEVKLLPDEFRSRALAVFPLVEERDAHDLEVLQQLYERLLELDKAGVNGIWARIVKNAFAPLFQGRFDYVAGNPPWVNWENLPGAYREATAPLWRRYGLFPHTGLRARLGTAKDDISILMTYASADAFLNSAGKLGFVITQTVFKTPGGGAGFRRFRIGDSEPLGPLHVDDMSELKPFEGAANRTAVVVVRKGQLVRYPVPYLYWRKKVRNTSIPMEMQLPDVTRATVRFNWVARPIEPSEPTSPWITGRPAAVECVSRIVGQSEYRGRAGTCGWANGVYWLEMLEARPDNLLVVSNLARHGRRSLDQVQTTIEPDLVFPLLRGEDVQRWSATPSCHVLLPQDPERPSRALPEGVLRVSLPKTYGYLKKFEDTLRGRAGYKKYFDPATAPFYSVYNTGPYTLAPQKVVWREQASSLTAAVVDSADAKPIVPDHKLMLVPIGDDREAHYLCGVLNSLPAQYLVLSYAVEVQMDTHVLEYMCVPKFSPGNPVHERLSELSKQAHGATAAGKQEEVRDIEAEVHELAAKLWGLSKAELKEIQQSLAELRG
jgi:SAM-dependent methyltransferase